MEYIKVSILKPLCCCVCDKSIVSIDKIYKKARKNSEYKDVYILFTNGQKMRVQMCSDCHSQIDDGMIDFVMERHYKTWEESNVQYDLTVESFTS